MDGSGSLLALLGWASAKLTWLPFSLQSAMVSSLFIECGWLIRKHQLKDKLEQPKAQLFCLGLWLLSLGATFYTKTHMSMVRCEFPHGPIDVIGAIAASILILNGSKKLSQLEHPAKKFLLFFVSSSLLAMCVHYVDACVLPIQQIYDQLMPANKLLAILFVLLFLGIRVAYTSFGVRLVQGVQN